MSKNKHRPATAPARTFPVGAAIGSILILGSCAGLAWFLRSSRTPSPPAPRPAATVQATAPLQQTNNFAVMEVATAVIVTAELDFGPQVPSIADALKDIERRSQPEDDVGRTFAVLDAYGEPTPQARLHISMHVSAEKPGKAALIFKRTGEVLWQTKIIPSDKKPKFSGKDLMILIDNGDGKLWTVDGSNNPKTVIDANIKEVGVPLRDLWLDQTEREVTFLYSACGCPVKVMARRDGERTVRTKDLPVIFPDDPAAVSVIERVMGWKN